MAKKREKKHLYLIVFGTVTVNGVAVVEGGQVILPGAPIGLSSVAVQFQTTPYNPGPLDAAHAWVLSYAGANLPALSLQTFPPDEDSRLRESSVPQAVGPNQSWTFPNVSIYVNDPNVMPYTLNTLAMWCEYITDVTFESIFHRLSLRFAAVSG